MSRESRKRIALIVAYKDPDYVRNRSLSRALGEISTIEPVLILNKAPGASRYFEVLKRLRTVMKSQPLDAIIIGFRGYELFWPVRALVGPKVPIILDAMMSPYGALVEERKFGLPGFIVGIGWYPIERSTMRAADFVLTDTSAHQTYLADLHGISIEKIAAVPVGAEENVSTPAPEGLTQRGKLTVLFYGSFLPLHGIEVILEAVSRLSGESVRFEFVGGCRRDAMRITIACERAGIEYSHQKWIEYETLISDVIPRADLCLGGPFGDTPQAHRVVTGKTTQFLAMAKATLVGLPVPVSGFVDKINCLLVNQGDPDELTQQIRWAVAHREELAAIGKAGQRLYYRQFSIDIIRDRLKAVLDKVLS